MGFHMTDNEMTKVIEMHLSQANEREIMSRTGVSRTSLRRIVQAYHDAQDGLPFDSTTGKNICDWAKRQIGTKVNASPRDEKNFEDYDKDLLYSSKFGIKGAAKELGRSFAHINTVVKANRAGKDRDYSRLFEISLASRPIARWACVRNGLDFDRDVLSCNGVLSSDEEVQTEIMETETTPDQTEILRALADLRSDISRLIGAVINAQNAMLDSHKELVTVINSNSDIIQHEISVHKDILDGIKCNTRQRKGQ